MLRNKYYVVLYIAEITFFFSFRNRLPENPNARGPLRDEPDFTYADEKPTPYNIRQRVRIVKQMTYGVSSNINVLYIVNYLLS